MPMTAFLVVVILGIAAFAVDLGVQRVAARDVQAVSDLAALDAARKLPTCDAAVLGEAAKRSAARQDAVGNFDSNDLIVEAGRLDSQGDFQVATTNCTAVRVEARTEVAHAFAIGSGSAARAAVATQQPPAVCFSVGSFLASLDTSSATFLPDWFGDILGVDAMVLSPSGVAALSSLEVPLADLWADLDALSPQGVLDTQVTALRMAQVIATLVHQQGLAGADASIDAIVAALDASAKIDDLYFKIGDILALDSTDDAAMSGSINVLDLLGVALEAAATDPDVAAYQLALSGQLVQASVDLVKPAKIACGRPGVAAKATSSQVDVSLNVPLNLVNLNLGVLALGLTGSVPVTVSVAKVEGTLTNVVCAAGSTPASISVAMAGAGASLAGSATVNLKASALLVINATLNPTLSLSSSAALPAAQTINLVYDPPDVLPSGRYAGDLAQLLTLGASLTFPPSGLLNTLLGAVAGGLNGLTGFLLPLVTSSVSGLLTPALNVVTHGLGLNLVGADVRAITKPECRGVGLVG